MRKVFIYCSKEKKEQKMWELWPLVCFSLCFCPVLCFLSHSHQVQVANYPQLSSFKLITLSVVNCLDFNSFLSGHLHFHPFRFSLLSPFVWVYPFKFLPPSLVSCILGPISSWLVNTSRTDEVRKKLLSNLVKKLHLFFTILSKCLCLYFYFRIMK